MSYRYMMYRCCPVNQPTHNFNDAVFSKLSNLTGVQYLARERYSKEYPSAGNSSIAASLYRGATL
jgi:hypothetical protein